MTDSAPPEFSASAGLDAQAEVDSTGLGRLKPVVDLRSVWLTEAGHFTPWLFNNMDVLSDAIGLTFTPVAMEHPVGPYRLDILAADSHGHNVAIENQVEIADHSHLGQLLLYAAHVNAKSAVWISPRFRDEQRQALLWLNENTVDGVRFYGVELTVVRIGASAPAPVFNVVVRPNELQKAEAGSAPGEVSDTDLVRREFLDNVLDKVASEIPGFRRPTGSSYRGYVSFRSGPWGYFAVVFTREQRLRVEAYLDSGNEQRNKTLFDELLVEKGAWEGNLGFELDWERLDGARASRVATYLDFWLPGGEGKEPDAIAWAAGRTVKMIQVLEQHLRSRAVALRTEAAAAGIG